MYMNSCLEFWPLGWKLRGCWFVTLTALFKLGWAYGMQDNFSTILAIFLCLFNRPSVVWAVLQTPLLIISERLILHKNIFKPCISHTVSIRKLKFWESMCHISHVTCDVSPVKCHVSCVACDTQFFNCLLRFLQRGKTIRLRVCYQQG